ncbi:thiosulfate:glutathione sulfurtransferase [Protopterus annectens]|uniref:thiosulfate:glutathione sulfurtransferase n=1 Tax=Protopterus annectens TaxID=7888 RepID=UPI001CFA6DDE|nr:thiosulfate:glutathione sulfurtransferase [Protopterus annectens]
MLHFIKKGGLGAAFIRKLAATSEGTRTIMNKKDSTISCSDLKTVMAKGSLQIFDVRTEAEVEMGTIPNSINIPVDEIEAALKRDDADFKQKYKINKPKLEDNIVFYCQMGRRGARSTDIAQSLGYKNAHNLAGGFQEWSAKEEQ